MVTLVYCKCTSLQEHINVNVEGVLGTTCLSVGFTSSQSPLEHFSLCQKLIIDTNMTLKLCIRLCQLSMKQNYNLQLNATYDIINFNLQDADQITLC